LGAFIAEEEAEVEAVAAAGVADEEVGWVVGVVTWLGLQATATPNAIQKNNNFFIFRLISK
jgi:hypothetical protein